MASSMFSLSQSQAEDLRETKAGPQAPCKLTNLLVNCLHFKRGEIRPVPLFFTNIFVLSRDLNLGSLSPQAVATAAAMTACRPNSKALQLVYQPSSKALQHTPQKTNSGRLVAKDPTGSKAYNIQRGQKRPLKLQQKKASRAGSPRSYCLGARQKTHAK